MFAVTLMLFGTLNSLVHLAIRGDKSCDIRVPSSIRCSATEDGGEGRTGHTAASGLCIHVYNVYVAVCC